MKIAADTLKEPIEPDRVRNIRDGGFAFLPHRFLRDGFLRALGREPLALYVFLLLAANRHGVSYYPYDTICAELRMPLEVYLGARNRLIELDLLAFDGTRFQLLSLPDILPASTTPRTLKTPDDLQAHDPATIRSIVRDSLARPRRRHHGND